MFTRPSTEGLRAVAQLGSALDWGSRGRRFKSCQPDRVMSQDIADTRTYGNVGPGVSSFRGSWLVVAVWVDGELAEQFAGDGVDDAYVEVLDEQDDVGSGVGSSDADVAELAGHAQGDAAGLVDDVVADPVVGLGVV